MAITFLGTGSSHGVPVVACSCLTCRSSDTKDKRLRSAIHLSHAGKSIIIDSGPDLRYQALRAGIQQLDTLLCTHEHIDHIGGLSEVRGFVFKQKRPIAIYASAHVIERLQREFHYLFPQTPPQGIPNFEAHIIKGCAFETTGLTVVPIRIYHNRLPIWGFKVGKLTYITDAKFVPKEEISKLNGTTVLIVNALQKAPNAAHFSLEEALDFAQKVNAEVTYLTHIGHRMGLHEKVSQELPENVYLAYDGLQFSL